MTSKSNKTQRSVRFRGRVLGPRPRPRPGGGIIPPGLAATEGFRVWSLLGRDGVVRVPVIELLVQVAMLDPLRRSHGFWMPHCCVDDVRVLLDQVGVDLLRAAYSGAAVVIVIVLCLCLLELQRILRMHLFCRVAPEETAADTTAAGGFTRVSS